MLLTFASLFPLQIDSGSGEHFDVSHFYVALFSTVKPTHSQTLEMSVPAVHIVLQYRVVSRVQMNQLSHTQTATDSDSTQGNFRHTPPSRGCT